MALPMHASLSNRYYFPAFSELPASEDLDNAYYAEQSNGLLVPNRTWTFFGEIVNDSLSQMPVLGNRVEVRDVTGDVHSILFFPTAGTLNMADLKTGHTVFVRYAHRCYFSDLSTEALKIENLNFVKVIAMNLDTLLYTSSLYFDNQGRCHHCHSSVAHLGGSTARCEACTAATYCNGDCAAGNRPVHRTFCPLCRELAEIYNIDFERFIEVVPFRQ